jgi:carbon storage regulator
VLVLSRKRDESIHIGDEIVVTVIEVRGDRVRLGVEAPEAVPVHRREIYEAIQREKASRSPAPAPGPIASDGTASPATG